MEATIEDFTSGTLDVFEGPTLIAEQLSDALAKYRADALHRIYDFFKSDRVDQLARWYLSQLKTYESIRGNRHGFTYQAKLANICPYFSILIQSGQYPSHALARHFKTCNLCLFNLRHIVATELLGQAVLAHYHQKPGFCLVETCTTITRTESIILILYNPCQLSHRPSLPDPAHTEFKQALNRHLF